jgi:CBS domain-containing membrane protein
LFAGRLPLALPAAVSGATMPFRPRDFIPDQPLVSLHERLRSALGALIGILATGVISRLAVSDASALPVLIAPMGASAVLLFAVPSSPLAQPWSILGGNLVAALVGVTAALLVTDPFVAAALAIGCTIALMMSLRCVHPPSGAVALTAVLGGSAIRELGYGFVLWPVAANSVLLLATALVFNNLAGRSYPRGARPPASHNTKDLAPAARVGFSASAEDVDAALKKYDRVLDIGRDDLDAILHEAQIRAYGRLTNYATCGAIMSRDVIAIAPEAPLKEALALLREHHIKVLPVTDEKAHVVGIVTQTDLLDKAAWTETGPRLGFKHRVRLTLQRARAPNGSVEDIMTVPVRSIGPDTSIGEAAMRMADLGLHHLPVVGADEKLIGIVSQSDLIVALMANRAVGQASAPAGAMSVA